jgi:hypothetical protein
VDLSQYVTIAQACKMLHISRLTFQRMRERERYKEIKIGRQIYIRKEEILAKLQLMTHVDTPCNFGVTIADEGRLPDLLQDGTIDLRRIRSIDAFGIVSLLCSVIDLARRAPSRLRLEVDGGFVCKVLQANGFFLQLEHVVGASVAWDKPTLGDVASVDDSVALPLTRIGYKGGERKIAEQLAGELIVLGFSEDIAGYIAWLFGELGDNALTHSKSAPCYLAARCSGVDDRFVELAIGDVGVGIAESLKRNQKFAPLSDSIAVLTAFHSNVSSWPDEHRRGQGLNDVLRIAIANTAGMRVDSGEHGFLMRFDADQPPFVQRKHPLLPSPGTRIGLTLRDRSFNEISRADADRVLAQELRRQ